MVFVLFETAYDDCHSYLKERVGLAGEEACGLFRQMVEIVHSLHQRGICLNDLKLRKFLFTDSSRYLIKTVFILEFGCLLMKLQPFSDRPPLTALTFITEII